MANLQGYSTLPVLGTQWTMLKEFYNGRLEAHDIKKIVPDEAPCFHVGQITWDGLNR